jgi:hypothetical protein
MLVEMQICTFFNPDLKWREHLQPLMGRGEVVKLDTKLREMNVVNLDSLHVFNSSMFSSPPPELENEFADLLMAIGSWPAVRLFSYFTWLLSFGVWKISVMSYLDILNQKYLNRKSVKNSTIFA